MREYRSEKVMMLVDPYTSHMRCSECSSEHWASIAGGGGYYRGAWQCSQGCRPTPEGKLRRAAHSRRQEVRDAVEVELHAGDIFGAERILWPNGKPVPPFSRRVGLAAVSAEVR
jgi:hypothetical protein